MKVWIQGPFELVVDLRHQAQVDENHAVVVRENDVPRVQIGVHEAVLEDHLQDCVQATFGERLAVAADLLGLGGSHTFHELHRQHAFGAEVVVEVRHVHAVDVGEILREASVVRSLEAKVELVAHGLAEALDGTRQREEPNARNEIQDLRPRHHEHQIPLDLDSGRRALDLHRGLRPVVQLRDVHLSHRCGGHRLGIDAHEPGARGVVELGVEHLRDLRVGHRRDPVLKPGERLGDAGSHDVGAGAQDLPELHVGGAETLEHVGEHLAAKALSLARRDPPRCQPAKDVNPERRQEDPDDVQEPEGEAERPHIPKG